MKNKKIVCMGFIIIFLLVLNIVYAQEIFIETEKDIFKLGETIYSSIKIKNSEAGKVNWFIDYGIVSKDKLYTSEKFSKSLILEQNEESIINLSLPVSEIMPPGEYEVYLILWSNTNKLKEIKKDFEIQGTKKPMEASISTCTDKMCKTVKYNFISGEKIYIVIEGSTKELNILGKVLSPSNEISDLEFIDNIAIFESLERGKHTIETEITAKDYTKINIKNSFLILSCNRNGRCEIENGENYKTCPEDCVSDSVDKIKLSFWQKIINWIKSLFH